MALPPDFAEQSLYGPEAWFIHDVLTLDREAQRVVAFVDTTQLGPLVDAQHAVPGHPKHVPGAVCVQLTGTLATLLSAYVLDMRRTDGWVGFGTHIHEARFPTLGEIGPPVEAACTAKKVRSFRGTTFVRYAYHYTQEGRDLYVAEHTGAWFRPE
ncbi:MAG: hypothetical protein AAGA48_34025 [Myxococcota bacterium]